MEKESDHINSIQDGDQHDVVPMDDMDEQSAAKEKLTDADPNKIKFTSINLVDNKNGEAKVDIHVVHTSIGMGKEELMKYANEPFWVRLRLFLFALFWIGWIAMLVGAVVIILVAPRCPPAPHLEWYQKTCMYQVHVPAFKDSDGDGIGDLLGLSSALDYFSKINVKTLLLSGIYPMTAGLNNGILNHTAVDSRVGTMADMDLFLAKAKDEKIKVILDFIPNESSDEHPWFKASREGNDDYKDFYVWVDVPRTGEPYPNNWLSEDSSPAWTRADERSQFYYHTFSSHEPELNLRNEVVQAQLKDVLRFWLDKGVDGFKVVHASHLVEDSDLKDEPLGDRKVSKPKYTDLNHAFTIDQPENYALMADWKELLNNYSASTGSEKILMAELSGGVNSTLKYYGDGSSSLVDFPINMRMIQLKEESSPYDLKEILDSWIKTVEKFGWPNWMLGNQNIKRLMDRVGPELIDGIHMVSMLTRGTPITYYGDELAMKSAPAGETSYMPWVNTSTVSEGMNVEAQMLDSNSHLKIFSYVAELRDQQAIKFGTQHYPLVTESVFSMIRVRKGSPAYLVLLNMSPNDTVVDFGNNSNSTFLPEMARVEIRSRNIVSGPLVKADHPKIKLSEVAMGAKQAAVFSFVPKFED